MENIQINQQKMSDPVRHVFPELPSGVIDFIEFNIFSTDEIDKESAMVIETSDDLKDLKLGPHGQNDFCGTCNNSFSSCPGHMGSIILPMLIHPLLRAQTIYVLSCICNDCGKLLVSERQLKEEGILKFRGTDRLRHVRNYIRDKNLVCEGSLDKDESKETKTILCKENYTYLSTKQNKKEVGVIFAMDSNKSQLDKIFPDEIFRLFNAITDKDANLLGFNTKLGQHPRRLIIERLAVIPYCTRSDPTFGGSQQNSDLTTAYKNVLTKRAKYRNPQSDLAKKENDFKELYRAVTAVMQNDGSTNRGRKQNQKDIFKQISGKEGVARAISQGKRVNSVGRSVAAPGMTTSHQGQENLMIRADEVGVPEKMAANLTRTIPAAAYNIDELQSEYDNGKVNYIIMATGKYKGVKLPINGSFIKRNPGYSIQLGDQVFRQLKDGDFVIFHRSPTLETGNMLVLKAKITKEFVLRVNPSIVNAMNLDFDGDETQVHVIQTYDAYAESIMGASIPENLLSYSTGKAIIALTYDALTGAYLLTKGDVVVDPTVWQHCVQPISDAVQFDTYDQRLEKYGIDKYSGRGMFSSALPEGFSYQEGDIIVNDGILVQGTLNKKTLGTSAGGFITEMRKQFKDELDVVVDFITNARLISSRWLQSTGYTIHLGDCMPDNAGDQAVLIEKTIDEYRHKIINIRKVNYQKKPRPEEERATERMVLSVLGDLMNIQGKIIEEGMNKSNNFLKSINAGSKGSTYNLRTIRGSIGQQTVSGRTVELTLPGRRSLPSFQPQLGNEGEPPEMRGFCSSNFSESLEPHELFFHMASTREALVKASKSTADTGNIERTIIKACEDVNIGVGRATIGADNIIIQPVYGGDAMDPRESEVVDGERTSRNFIRLAKTVSLKYEYL